MKKLKSTALQLWKDESGQGTAEYVLILVAIVAVAFLFKGRITEILREKMNDVGGEISRFTSGNTT